MMLLAGVCCCCSLLLCLAVAVAGSCYRCAIVVGCYCRAGVCCLVIGVVGAVKV